MKENVLFDMAVNVAFTGHRDLSAGLDYNLLDRVIKNLILNGAKRFYCGMAHGFDLAAAESLISLRKSKKIELIACIPCPEQFEFFSGKTAERYAKIIEKCDEKIVLSENYYSGCMQFRDRYLVDNSDILVSYLRKKSGGTFYTVDYAYKCGKTVIEI